jgi:hypothetical protein
MKKTKGNKRKPKENKELFSHADFLKQVKKEIGPDKRSILKESLTFIKPGSIQCMACSQVLICIRSLHRHCAGAGLKKKISSWNTLKKKQALIEAQPKPYEHPDVSVESNYFRVDALESIATANITIAGLEEMRGCLEKYSKPGHTLGYVRDIPRYYAKTLHGILKMEIKRMISARFDSFGLIFYGTPSFAEAEAIKIRLVTKSFDMVELLVKMACFQKKLNSNNIVNH